MNEKNFEYLKKQIEDILGEGLEDQLRQHMEDGKPTFQLSAEKQFGEGEQSNLLTVKGNFRLSEESSLYFFNNVNASLTKGDSVEKLEQTFYVNRNSSFSMDEMHNLMCGRWVNKDLERLERVGEGEETRFVPTGELYNSWVRLDFKEVDRNGNHKLQHNKNYNFNIEAAVGKNPPLEWSDAQKKSEMITAMSRGDIVKSTYEKNGKQEIRHLEANPPYGMVNHYDKAMKLLPQAQGRSRGASKSKGKGTEKDEAKDKAEKAGKGRVVSMKRGSDRSRNSGMSMGG